MNLLKIFKRGEPPALATAAVAIVEPPLAAIPVPNPVPGALRAFQIAASRKTRQAPGFFNAAAIAASFNDWNSTLASADSEIRFSLATLRARGRNLRLNNEFFQKFLSLLKTNVVGPEGITLKNKAADPMRMVKGRPVKPLDIFANSIIEDEFYNWGQPENCTVSKDMSLPDVENLILETAATEGEGLIRKIRGPAAGNKYGFALQPIDSDLLDTEYNQDLRDGKTIRMGVEKDSDGKRLAYWLFKSNPYELFHPGNTFDQQRIRVPAEDIIHPYLMRRIGQTRGYPWGVASYIRLQMLAGYDEAEITGARAESCKGTLLKRVNPDASYTGPEDGAGNHLQDLAPGQSQILDPGLEPVFVDFKHPNGNYDPFTKACLRGIAAGLLVSYPTLANDYASINFSSGRMSQMEERELWIMLQNWFSSKVMTPIFSDWLGCYLTFSDTPLPMAKFDKFNAPNWHGRRWKWVQPEQEIAAKILELNSGITSLTRVYAELGIDRDEILDEIADDKEALKSRGIELPELYQKNPQLVAAEAVAAGAAEPGKDDSGD